LVVTQDSAGEDQMVGKRHASQEIAAKLAQANELAAKGRTQREISKALGVSIMTYHRWRKMLNSAGGSAEDGGRSESEPQPQGWRDASSAETIKRLELENSQLRRLVTDMLLSKLKLEEELHARQEARRRGPDKG
jgi:transposase